MKRIFFSVLAGALLSGMAVAQTSAQTSGSASQGTAASTGQSGAQAQSSTSQQAAAQQSENQLQPGSVIYAELSKTIDAKKAKPGDQVQAKTTEAVLSHGKVLIPKGSKIIGHVTEAKAREKGQEQSSLGIAFDHAVLKNGTQVPMSGVSIQAIGSAQSAAALASQETNPPMGGAGGGMPPYGGGGRPGGGALGGTMGGAANTAGGAVGSTAGTVAGTTQAGASAAGHLGASSRGVVNMPGLELSASASNSTQGSLVTSDKKNVKLDSGTEMVLRVNQ